LSSGFCYFIPLYIGVANAQETVKATNPDSEITIAQATGNQPNRRRLELLSLKKREATVGFGDFCKVL
jgi:hypothetical protein